MDSRRASLDHPVDAGIQRFSPNCTQHISDGFRVNPTTVALSLLLLILVLAAEWGLRYAVVVSIFATAAYNFFFLPPVDTFTIADSQNWLALFCLPRHFHPSQAASHRELATKRMTLAAVNAS